MARHPQFQPARHLIILTAVLLTLVPSQGRSDELATPSDRPLSEILQLLKEEDSVSIESRGGQRVSPLSSELFVMTDEDIRESGATDLPTLLLRMLGHDASQEAEQETNGRVRADSHLIANRLLLVVDGRSINIDMSDALPWKNIPVTLSDIKRIEVWNEAVSAIHGFNDYDAVINIRTKTSER
jgi:iron complex outermembrane receptor protein